MLLTTVFLLTGATTFAAGKARLDKGHLDIGVGYENGELTLGLHDDSTDTEYNPRNAIIVVNPEARTAIPDDPAFGFLGNPDLPAWILPEVQNTNLAFLGFGADDLASGVVSNDTVRVQLLEVSGPGEVALYNLDFFGAPRLVMNSRDGIFRNDRFDIVAGGDAHQNWAFSRPGVYRVTFQAWAVLPSGETVRSKRTTYTVEVLRKSKDGDSDLPAR